MRNVGAQKDQVTRGEAFHLIADNAFAIAFHNVDQFAFGVKMKGRAEVGHIAFDNDDLLLR
jgi:hypothetical protein